MNVTTAGPEGTRRRPSALWLWSSTEASRALQSRDLAVILRTYRRLNGLSQEQLALSLGYDKTYISMIETRTRIIRDVTALRQIARRLGIPVHVLRAGTQPLTATIGRCAERQPSPADECPR